MDSETFSTPLNESPSAASELIDYRAWLNSPLWSLGTTMLIYVFIASAVAVFVPAIERLFLGLDPRIAGRVAFWLFVIGGVVQVFLRHKVRGRLLKACRLRINLLKTVILAGVHAVVIYRWILRGRWNLNLGLFEWLELAILAAFFLILVIEDFDCGTLKLYEGGLNYGTLRTWDRIRQSWWVLGSKPVLMLNNLQDGKVEDLEIPLFAGDVHEVDRILTGHIREHEPLPDEARLDD